MIFAGLLLYFVATVVALFTVVNPLSTTTIFLSLTDKFSKKEKQEAARDATITAFVILLFFALTGFILFEFFSFTLGSFKIMGGLFLFSVAWKMLKGEGKELHPAHSRNEITLVPLAIPLISGPATIVTSIVLFNQAENLVNKSIVLLAIILVLFVTYMILQKSHLVIKLFKEKGIRVLNKLMGLILGSLAVQFIINGIIDTIPTIINAI